MASFIESSVVGYLQFILNFGMPKETPQGYGPAAALALGDARRAYFRRKSQDKNRKYTTDWRYARTRSFILRGDMRQQFLMEICKTQSFPNTAQKKQKICRSDSFSDFPQSAKKAPVPFWDRRITFISSASEAELG